MEMLCQLCQQLDLTKLTQEDTTNAITGGEILKELGSLAGLVERSS
jgi:hypothetical protein